MPLGFAFHPLFLKLSAFKQWRTQVSLDYRSFLWINYAIALVTSLMLSSPSQKLVDDFELTEDEAPKTYQTKEVQTEKAIVITEGEYEQLLQKAAVCADFVWYCGSHASMQKTRKCSFATTF